MRNLLMAAVLIMGLTTFAQEGKKVEDAKARTEQLTPQQRQELRLKELTLKLDLSASQQKEMSKILSEQQAKRTAAIAERKTNKDAAKQLTAEEKFARKNKRLDDQIAMQQRLRSFLTPEQMTKWEQMKAYKSKHSKRAKHGQHEGKKRTGKPVAPVGK
ncbi:MAG TPA: hypothetical protein VF676_06110 [Flavobacterium sp.]|jgi:hypothetical protein